MISKEKTCLHCGDFCKEDTIEKNGKLFCCSGCLFVYEILHDSVPPKDYDLSKLKSISPKRVRQGEFDFLLLPEVIEKLLIFNINSKSKVIFRLPNIYCSACVWLLENITRMDPGILESKVNFLRKEISILFDNEKTDLKQIASLLSSIGYKPSINLADIESKAGLKDEKSLIIKLGIAFFFFANIMLFAFPEYLSNGTLEPDIKIYLRYLSLIASVPVLYAGSDYFKGALASIRLRILTIDVPLSIGILALFLRSAYEILTMTGSGYGDSLAGLIFFLLLGKVFQKKTFYNLSFERDYKSYFPLSVVQRKGGKEETVPINKIKTGNYILIRNSEIIPVDTLMLGDNGLLDYSFLTGESKPVEIKKGDKIFSGARNIGSSIELQVLKDFKQSYMTEIWSNQLSKTESKGNTVRISTKVSKYFSIAVLLISAAGFLYWLPKDSSNAVNVFVSILIVACPCAIALSTPFSYGTAIRQFAKFNFFLKNEKVVEDLASINTIVFDKTGTLTESESSKLEYKGRGLSTAEKDMVKSVTRNSTHPYSRMIYNELEANDKLMTEYYTEHFGRGISAKVNNIEVKIGKRSFVSTHPSDVDEIDSGESSVYISFENEIAGYYSVSSKYREGIFSTINELAKEYQISILTGDNESEKKFLNSVIEETVITVFNQSPEDKLFFVKNQQETNNRVLMLGDGLNDAGALKQSDVGIAVSENAANFTPGSDAILNAENVKMLRALLILSKDTVRTVYYSYALSLAYNIAGFIFALSGLLTPVIAAVLMPLSSVSVVLLTVLKVTFHGQKLKKLIN